MTIHTDDDVTVGRVGPYVDTSTAGELLGMAGRTGVHNLVVTGQLHPVARLNGGNVFIRSDVMHLAYKRRSR